MTIELTLLSRVAYRNQEVTGAGPRGLLAVLAGDLRTGSSTARLVEALWPDEQPEHPTKALQILVSRARARLGPELIVSTPTGYRLALRPDQVDAEAVLLEAAASERATDAQAALAHAESGLALCEGAQDHDAADPLSALRNARATTYRSLVRSRALALSRLGRATEAIEPLRALAAEHPRDETILAELLRSEAATAGPAEALTRYDAYRRTLRDELGTEPGPALRTAYQKLLLIDAPVVRSGVRQEPNPMLGRDRDAAAVADLLKTARVTSIVGPGGLGKTRLAHAVARAADQRVVHFVALAGATADSDVLGEVAEAMGVRGADAIVDALGPGLLVLDNCEHVVRGTAALVQALVSRSADLRVLTTSRAPLGLSSESVYPLPELDLPTMVDLFGQRARAVRPDVDLPPSVVRQLSARLDGLPLAAELAAARVRVMSVPEIASRLDDRFAVLRGSTRDAPGRHQTLHAVIDWSWHLLEPAGQAAMRALSVFPGGFTAAAARRLLGDDAILEQLVDQSLLRVGDGGSGTRFRMLETVREFSTARRAEAGETDRVVDGFLAWAGDYGEQWQEADLTSGSLAVGAIRAEQDNLVQALRYGLERADGATVAVTAAMLGSLWITESNFTRLAGLAEDTAWVLSHFRPGPGFVEATRTAAVLGAMVGFVTPELSPARALVTLRRLPAAEPDTLIRAAHIALCAKDLAALEELATADRTMLAGVANYVLSYVWENSANDLDRALLAARRMLACFDDDGPPVLRAVAHGRVGELSLQVDPGEEALRHLDAALAITTELGWSTATRGRWALVLANLQRGAFDEAERALDEEAPAGAEDLAGFELCARAEIRLGRGDIDGGLRLWREAADRVRGATGAGLWPFEVEAVAVLTHARFGRLDLVDDLVTSLPGILARTLPTATAAGFPVCGTLLLALAMTELDTDPARAVRMIALAERFGLLRGFQPTMSPERIRGIARKTDGPAYADAVSAYASLDHEGLRSCAQRLGSRLNSARAHP
ncbi:putative ATPase [Asanoa ferruginea]|uniref:Putative ATPase n=1 Tax=Asanoa ferruginea TaxID=53367 RepID=A0A3D9ZC94_9ACTN|nr:BTAD domain-containing putative transcriptional regulator [Asanoa ferruginea]REF94094.1 putative ATPase [Asanoa ferruginea]GIF46662.1 SARP family transcriptional regulator [Asanoa ferruginea]